MEQAEEQSGTRDVLAAKLKAVLHNSTGETSRSCVDRKDASVLSGTVLVHSVPNSAAVSID